MNNMSTLPAVIESREHADTGNGPARRRAGARLWDRRDGSVGLRTEPRWKDGVVTRCIAGLVVLLMFFAFLPSIARAQSSLPSVASDDSRRIGGLLGDSLKLLLIEHGTRIAF